MESSDSKTPESGDYSAAVPLEISSELAGKADDLLRGFAEDAGLETALIVDRSGALVAGISAEADVTIEVISALVAGASGAMRALVEQLGETGAVESLHLGGERMIYLREIVNRFILVGVSDSSRPAGLVRQKAQSIEADLSELLNSITTGETPIGQPLGSPGVRSLREVALKRAAERRGPVVDTERVADHGNDSNDFARSGEDTEKGTEQAEPTVDRVVLEDKKEPIPGPPVTSIPKLEPRKVLEPLDFGEPEIVIEETRHPNFVHLPVMAVPADSPFETEDEEEMTHEVDSASQAPAQRFPTSESIFEFEDLDSHEDFDGDTDDGQQADNEGIESVIETDVTEISFERSPEVNDNQPQEPQNIFEIDESDVESDADTDSDTDSDTEDIGDEINEMIDAEDEESEVRNSGPFYF